MMKKISAIALGLILIVSAVIINGDANVNYAQILDKKILENKKLRRFSGGIRRGTANSFQSKTIEKKALNKQLGLIRPRKMKSTEDNSLLKKRTVSNRVNSFSASRSNKVTDSSAAKIKNISFKNISESNKNTGEYFQNEIEKFFPETNNLNNKIDVTNIDQIRLIVKQIPIVSENIAFSSVARDIANRELMKAFDLTSDTQAKKVVSHFGKNHIVINQETPTYFFEKISRVDQYNADMIVIQRVQQNPNGGYFYLQVVGSVNQVAKVLNTANTAFNSFNLK